MGFRTLKKKKKDWNTFKVISSKPEVLPISPLNHNGVGEISTPLSTIPLSKNSLAGFHKVNARVLAGVPKM